MYKISDTQYAIEEGDRITFVKDGGGQLEVEGGDEGAPGPERWEKAEIVILSA